MWEEAQLDRFPNDNFKIDCLFFWQGGIKVAALPFLIANKAEKMKTTKISFWFLSAAVLLLPVLSHSQHGTSVMERLTRNTWFDPHYEKTFTDSTMTITLLTPGSIVQLVSYYYLSDTQDTLFQTHKIGKATNGRFLHSISVEGLRANRIHSFGVWEILKLNEYELVLGTTRELIIGSRTARFVAKPD